MASKTGYAKAALAVSVLALAGCDTIGNPLQALGNRAPAPDEFSVIARAPLKMPGSRSLPEPRLGEVSPLEPNPNKAAIEALLGSDSAVASAPATAGEQALLSAANAASTDTAIRAQLEQDIVTREATKPYEPPTVFELFSADAELPPEDAIDAASEARRLQTEGIASAPIDPNAKPESAEDDPSLSGELGLSYENLDRRPSNKLPSSSTPAFE